MSSNGTSNGYTPTQGRMLAILSDEKPHNRFELRKCLNDELAAIGAVRVHITFLRRKLKSEGYGIRCELLSGETYYSLVKTSPALAE